MEDNNLEKLAQQIAKYLTSKEFVEAIDKAVEFGTSIKEWLTKYKNVKSLCCFDDTKEITDKIHSLKLEVQEEVAYHWNGYECQKSEMHKFDEDFDKIETMVKDLVDLKKSEENKKYLTYEDIMGLETQKVENGIRSSIRYKVKLNEHTYLMYLKQFVCSREISIRNTYKEVMHVFVNEKSIKDFITDLRLELVGVVEDED